MEQILSNVEWVPVVVSTILAFGLGWLWYSPTLFVAKWQEGLPQPAKWQAPMWMPMFSQFGSTLFLAVIVNILVMYGDWALLALITLTLMGFIKANGMYCGKSRTSISVEVLYILAMTLVLVAINLWM